MAVHSYPDKHYCAYFTEVQDIEDHYIDDSQDDESAQADDGEHSVGFLSDLGVKIDDITFFEAENNKLGDVPLTPAQHATLRRHVERVQTTLRPAQSRQRPDVRQLFHNQEPASCTPSSTSDDRSQKLSKDNVAHSFVDGAASSRVTEHHLVDVNKHAAGRDTALDEVYIPPPDYSMSEDLMAVPPGDSRSQTPCKHDTGVAVLSAEGSSSPCGVTVVDDLGKKDRKMLTTLAHLELMMLFDACSITYTRKKTRRKGSDHGVFNVTLQTLLDKDRKKFPHLRVPLVLQELVQYLEKNGLREEGLLRVSGRLARVKELREKIDRQYNKGKPISFDRVALHDAAALLKLFLRELPEPLLTSDRLNAFMQVDSVVLWKPFMVSGAASQNRFHPPEKLYSEIHIPDMQKQLYALNMLILVLPEVNRNVLLMLLDFLDKVIKETANKMTAENVAMVMAPNLFLLSVGSRNRPQAMGRELKLAVSTSKVTQLLLSNRTSLWTVPAALISQIRQKHEDSLSNPIMRLLGAKDKTDMRSRISSGAYSSNMEINVKVERTGVDAKVNIDSSTTVGNVIDMLARSPQMHRKRPSSCQVTDDPVTSNCCLYEVGGNIGERRLDHGANMMSVCQVNPNAKYIIRNQPE